MTEQDHTPETAERPEDMSAVNAETTESDVIDELDTIEIDMTEEVQLDDLMAKRIMQLESEIDKNRQGWQRTLAEFQNYKRRIEREQQNSQQKITIDIIAQILPIIDDFERALSNAPEDLQGHPWLNGVALIQSKFKRLMDERGISIIDPTGQPFDPNRHQAISMDDSDDVESGHVIDTLQKGYESGETVIRPALVRVAN